MKSTWLAPILVAAGLAVEGSAFASSLTADTNEGPNKNSGLFAPAAMVPLVFTATGANGETLTVTTQDAEGAVLDTQMLAVNADPWTTTITGSHARLGFYRVYGTLTDGTTIAPLGSRVEVDGTPSFVTYAIVPDPSQRAAVISDAQAFFGLLGMGNLAVGTDVLAYLGVRWTKTSDWSWSALEPNANQRNTFAPVPAPGAVETGSTNGASRWVVYSLDNLTVNGRPYSGSPDVCLPNTFSYNTCAIDPNYSADWQTFVTFVATNWPLVYPMRTQHYHEVTWEPIAPWGYGGTNDELVNLYALAYPAMKAADPQALVLGPTMFTTGPQGDPSDILAAGLAKYIDVLSTHPYMEGDTGYYGPEWPGYGYMDPELSGEPSRIATMQRHAAAAAGHPVPTVGTEQGYQTHQAVAYGIDQARRLIRQNLILLGEGWKMNIAFLFNDYPSGPDSQWMNPNQDYWDYGFFYNLDETAWGGYAPGKVSPKPVAPAYAAMTFLLEGRKSVNNVNWLTDTTRGYVYERFGDPTDEVLALWDFGGAPASVTIDAGAPSVDVYDWMGNKTSVATTGGNLTLPLTNEPTYIKGVASAVWGSTRTGQNVALAKTVTTSGDADANSGGSLAVDGDPWSNESRWVSSSDANAKWLAVDFGSAVSIGEVRFFTGQYNPTTNTNFYGSPLASYRLQRWDGASFIDIVSRTSNARAAVSEVFAPVTTTKLRLYVDPSAGVTNPVKLYELEALTTSPVHGGAPDAGIAKDASAPEDGGGLDGSLPEGSNAPSAPGAQPAPSVDSGCACTSAGRGASSSRAGLALLFALGFAFVCRRPQGLVRLRARSR